MAGGDHHSARGAEVLYRIGKRGGGSVIVGQKNVDAGSGQGLRNSFREIARLEARVIADNQTFAYVFMLMDVVGDGVADATHILEGVVVGDNAAPTVGSEFDLGHKEQLAISA